MKTIEVGGNKLTLRFGRFLGSISDNLKRRSDKLNKKGTPKLVANPTCKFINPFTLIINFTVNTTDKYQLVHEGDFRVKYKEVVKDDDIDDCPIDETELFIIIETHQGKWFLKNKVDD